MEESFSVSGCREVLLEYALFCVLLEQKKSASTYSTACKKHVPCNDRGSSIQSFEIATFTELWSSPVGQLLLGFS